MRILSCLIVLMIVFFQSTLSLAGEKEEAMGKQIYMRYCSQCHGEKGTGEGINSDSEAMDPAPQDLCDIEKPYMKEKDNVYLIEAIKLGGQRAFVTPLMPHWYKTLSEYEIMSVAAFIRTLHKHDQPPIDFSNANTEKPKITVAKLNIPNPTKMEKKIGKKIYKKNGCLGCHSIYEYGGTSGPVLDGVGSRLDPQQIWQIIIYPSSIKPDTKMPAFDINDENGALLVAYLSSLKEE